MSFEESVDRWFKFIEWYNKNYSVPLSDLLIPNQQITGFKAVGSPIGITSLSKREWNKLMDNNVLARETARQVAIRKKNKLMGNNAPVRNLHRGVAIREGGEE